VMLVPVMLDRFAGNPGTHTTAAGAAGAAAATALASKGCSPGRLVAYVHKIDGVGDLLLLQYEQHPVGEGACSSRQGGTARTAWQAIRQCSSAALRARPGASMELRRAHLPRVSKNHLGERPLKYYLK
jgi:hypothetical protein